MVNRLIALCLLLAGVQVHLFASDELPVPAPWRAAIYDFCRAKLQHSAWGVAHSERNFALALRLAKDEGLTIDDEVLFAAAFLHDAGAFEQFSKPNMDHTESGADFAAAFLEKAGFPQDKIPAVQEAIRTHMFYSKPGQRPEAVVLHDADTLDFLGHIGVARILSLTNRHRWAPDLKGAFETIQRFRKELPEKLVTKSAKKIAQERLSQMIDFISALEEQSNRGRSL